MSYGRHQSFYLKRHWITKGINALIHHDADILLDRNAFKYLGIGKNMHQSLRFWLEATNIVFLEDKQHRLSFFGNLLKEYDLGCNENISQLLIHFFLVTFEYDKVDNANTFIWFFNDYSEIMATKETLLEGLVQYDAGQTSYNTLNRDIDCLLNTYTNYLKSHAEDKNVSLLAELGLIRKKESNIYYKAPLKKEKYSYEAFYFILLWLKQNNFDLSIENLVNNKQGLGKIFNLNRIEVIDIIEKMKQTREFNIDIVRTNNLDTVSISCDLMADQYLQKSYKGGNHES
ncbi:MAG: DUF4007 family protein [Firmicutes bacterium]|nr:DUF4007 family protein [Bacillota bacterium]